jgi:hypothetical protein
MSVHRMITRRYHLELWLSNSCVLDRNSYMAYKVFFLASSKNLRLDVSLFLYDLTFSCFRACFNETGESNVDGSIINLILKIPLEMSYHNLGHTAWGIMSTARSFFIRGILGRFVILHPPGIDSTHDPTNFLSAFRQWFI